MNMFPEPPFTEVQRGLMIYRWNTIYSSLNGRKNKPGFRIYATDVDDILEMVGIQHGLKMSPAKLVKAGFDAFFGDQQATLAQKRALKKAS